MRSVLVVEDNTLVYDTISDAFALRGGFRVAHAADGRLGMAALESARHDLALIDVALPKISGVEVATRAVELGVPTVLMTGYDDALKAGEHTFPVLTKPFRIGELVARFDEVVAEAVRLNTMMRENMRRGAELTAQTRRVGDDFSRAWVNICKQLVR